jgi:Immunity protein 74
MANFSSPRANLVEGDNGVSIEVLGRTGIRYSERGRSCFVESEVLARPAIAVWASGIRSWDPPHAEDPLTDDDRRRILKNIADAFASQQWGLEIIAHRDPASVVDEIVTKAQEAGVTAFVHRRRPPG